MVHADVKKVSRIPDGGGGWRVHGRGSNYAKTVDRAKKQAPVPDTCTYTRPSTGSPASPTPKNYPMKKASPQ